MTQPDSPLKRSIGVSNLIRGLIALFAVIAIGAAFAAGRYALGMGATVFVVIAAVLGYRAWRIRQRINP